MLLGNQVAHHRGPDHCTPVTSTVSRFIINTPKTPATKRIVAPHDGDAVCTLYAKVRRFRRSFRAILISRPLGALAA